ncbi:MAG: hypothetical protein IM606_16935 [Cytophagales bacterium]|nr:hypothetical protein [Cytophagales bacterium]MCA6388647.1 hypothetical protein [Cytophagales bacterium]MCA6393283.1 hypothetical protein [Cytophagales bacterium]MCA6396871.1 hypothetical protein [Cytophagales bacterium]MCA6398005.1 hypothetical protein [Cytophagales bacterium]
MRNNKKIAVQILYFNSHHFILHTLANCVSHVDKIFLSYSPSPWSVYNKDALNDFKNQSSLDIVRQSINYSKVEIVQGVWETEEAQREACRLIAQEQGYDFLIVQDADEFYLPEDYESNIQLMVENPQYEVYQTPWINFWKSTRYALVHKQHLGVSNTLYSTCPLFAINLRLPVKFESRRVPKNSTSVFQLKGICFHLSYVFSDIDMFIKISTWGHAHQVNKNWFKWKWLAWHFDKRNINPFCSVDWVKAVPFTGLLPAELQRFENPIHISIQLTLYDRLQEFLHDGIMSFLYQLRQWRSKLT